MIFSKLYETVLRWAEHRNAPVYLGILSFTESSFFPIPPDVMLAPMVLAKRTKAWFFASLTTITSVLGGIAGYLIGVFLFDQIGQSVIELYHAEEKFAQTRQWFDQYGIWVVFLAGFTPIPYKLFTISAGALSMAFLPFVAASLVGRGARFFLVAGLIYWGGQPLADFLQKRADLLGWACVVLAVIAYFWLK